MRRVPKAKHVYSHDQIGETVFSQFENLPAVSTGRKFYLSWSHYLKLKRPWGRSFCPTVTPLGCAAPKRTRAPFVQGGVLLLQTLYSGRETNRLFVPSNRKFLYVYNIYRFLCTIPFYYKFPINIFFQEHRNRIPGTPSAVGLCACSWGCSYWDFQEHCTESGTFLTLICS